MHVLVTGASGYLGCATVRRLTADGHAVTAMVRRAGIEWPTGVSQWLVEDLCDLGAGAEQRLRAIVSIIHCAARVHVLAETAADPRAEFRRVNVQATLSLAAQAAAAGVARFVFLSSIGVNGSSSGRRAFGPDDLPQPDTPYAVSKWDAEQELQALSRRTGLAVISVRAPMIYGRNAPGNFALLCKAVRSGVPLPLGALREQRSFVAMDNMLDLLARLVTLSGVVKGTYLVSDGQDLSTADFVRLIARAMHCHTVLVPVPRGLLTALAGLVGRAEQVRKMAVPLTIDISRTRADLAWAPQWTVEQALQRELGPTVRSKPPTQSRSYP